MFYPIIHFFGSELLLTLFIVQRQRLRTLLQEGQVPVSQLPNLDAGHDGLYSLHAQQEHTSEQQPASQEVGASSAEGMVDD